MEEMIVRLVDLPCGIVAFTLLDEDGFYNIYINARCSKDMQNKGYEHELEHIKRNDWYNSMLVSDIEQAVRNAV